MRRDTRRGILTSLLPLAMIMLAAAPAGATCGKATVGEMNWPSGQILASSVRFILEVGYGCEVDLMQTATVPGISSMVEKGEPDVIPELWLNSVKTIYDRGATAGLVVDLGDVFEGGGVEGWWIPRYLSDAHPEMKTVANIIENSSLFTDPETPQKGRFYNCPPGWACQIV